MGLTRWEPGSLFAIATEYGIATEYEIATEFEIASAPTSESASVPVSVSGPASEPMFAPPRISASVLKSWLLLLS